MTRNLHLRATQKQREGYATMPSHLANQRCIRNDGRNWPIWGGRKKKIMYVYTYITHAATIPLEVGMIGEDPCYGSTRFLVCRSLLIFFFFSGEVPSCYKVV